MAGTPLMPGLDGTSPDVVDVAGRMVSVLSGCAPVKAKVRGHGPGHEDPRALEVVSRRSRARRLLGGHHRAVPELAVIDGHDFQRARIFVPWPVARTLAFTGAHPLRTDTMRPATSTTSGDVPSSPGMSGVPP